MRTGKWIAVTLGVVITGLGVGLAQEKKQPLHPLVKSAPRESTVGSNQESGTTKRRGGLTIQGQHQSGPDKATQALQRYIRQRNRTTANAKKAPATSQPQRMPTTGLPAARRTSTLQPAPRPPQDKSREVIHAEYRDDPLSNQNKIQQIDGSSDDASPFEKAARPDAVPVPIKLIDDTSDQQTITPAPTNVAPSAPIRVIPESPTPKATAPTRTIPTRTIPSTTAPTRTTPTRTKQTQTKQTQTKQAPAPTTPVEIAPRKPTRTARLTIQKATRPTPAKTTKIGPQTPMVTIEWVKDGDIHVGQECAFRLMVKNNGRTDASQIEVEAQFPNTVRLTSTTPKPNVMDDTIIWKFARLAPGAEQEIKIRMIPSQRGELATNAQVRFTGTAVGVFQVEEPLLQVVVQGPQEALVGEPAAHLITVSNPGTGIARNVKIEALIPNGLEHARGERLLMDIGSLTPGESRRVRLSLVAIGGGKHQLLVKAAGDANLAQSASSTINVIAPSLQLAVKGPGLRYLGRSAAFTFTVTNDGTIPSNNVRTKYKLPAGFRLLRADRGGKLDQVSRTIDWFVGSLDAGKSASMTVHLATEKLGAYTHHAVAVSEHGAKSAAQLDTRIEGSASLVLEIGDEDDPVEVGAQTSYQIRVRNAGTKAANKVSVSCEMTSGVEFVSADGPVDFSAENGLLVFKSLPTLAPGKAAVFQVTVRGVDPGNHRFRARLASDSIKEPLIFEELTTFYSE